MMKTVTRIIKNTFIVLMGYLLAKDLYAGMVLCAIIASCFAVFEDMMK